MCRCGHMTWSHLLIETYKPRTAPLSLSLSQACLLNINFGSVGSICLSFNSAPLSLPVDFFFFFFMGSNCQLEHPRCHFYMKKIGFGIQFSQRVSDGAWRFLKRHVKALSWWWRNIANLDFLGQISWQEMGRLTKFCKLHPHRENWKHINGSSGKNDRIRHFLLMMACIEEILDFSIEAEHVPCPLRLTKRVNSWERGEQLEPDQSNLQWPWLNDRWFHTLSTS